MYADPFETKQQSYPYCCTYTQVGSLMWTPAVDERAASARARGMCASLRVWLFRVFPGRVASFRPTPSPLASLG